MDNELIEKTYQNQLIIELKKSNYDYYERAEMIKYLLTEEKKRCKYGDGHVSDIVAKRLGVERKELYRTMTILSANTKTKALIRDGKISADKVTHILYNLKDKTKEDEMISRAIGENLNIVQAQRAVAEINDARSVVKHFHSDIVKFCDNLKRYEQLIDKMKDTDKTKMSMEAAALVSTLMRFRTKCGN
jgi:hypothetical protein